MMPPLEFQLCKVVIKTDNMLKQLNKAINHDYGTIFNIIT